MSTVLVVTSSYPRTPEDYRGIFVSNLVQALRKHRRIKILVPDDARGVLQQPDRASFTYFIRPLQLLAYGDGMMNNLRRQPWLIFVLPFFILFQVQAIIHNIRKDADIRIIHAHWWFPQGLSAVIANYFLEKKVKIICTLHGGDVFKLRGFFFNALKRFVFRRCVKIIVIAEPARIAILPFVDSAEKLLVIPAGIWTEQFPFQPKPFDRENPVILFVGRLLRSKGIFDLLAAFTLLHSSVPGAQLNIVGEGVERQALEAYCKEHDIAASVKFHGAVANENIIKHYHAADMLVLSSYSEGVPVVLMEAMAAGCIVVATPVGGVPDLIQDRITGFIIERGNSSALADTIKRILQSSESDMVRIREAARHCVAVGDYSLELQGEKINRIYTELEQHT